MKKITSALLILLHATQALAIGQGSTQGLYTTIKNPRGNNSVAINRLASGYQTTVTSGGTLGLTSTSPRLQFFTGTSAHTCKLPDATTLSQVGDQFEIHNSSTLAVAVQDNGGSLVLSIAGGQAATFTAKSIASANGSWDAFAGGGLTTLTTKGDLLSYTTQNARHAIPGDYGRMVPDQNASDGWRNASYSQLLNGRPGKNYIQYADFENNSTTGWTAMGCATLVNGIPTCVGSGGAALSSSNGGRAKGANTSAPAIDSSSAIAGTYAMNLATTGAGTIGDGYVSSLYSIDKADQAKVLSYKLYFKVASGTPVMGGTSADTYATAIYDPVNNAFLGASGQFSFNQSSGVGVAQGTFQTASNTASIQIFVYSPVAPTGASSLLFDDVYVGPQSLAFGPAVTDSVAETGITYSAGFGTVSSQTVFVKRIGDTLYGSGTFTAGTAAGSAAYLQLPSKWAIDTTKIASTGKMKLGEFWTLTSSGTPNANFSGAGNPGVLGYNADNGKLYFADEGSSAALTFRNGNNVCISASGDQIAFEFSVPIAGWSSNTAMSQDTDTRVVAVNAVFQAATGTISSSFNIAKFSINKDTFGGYNASTGLYTVPVTGYYAVSAALDITAAFSATNTIAVEIGRNGNGGADAVYGYTVAQVTGTTDYPVSASGVIYCNAGDTLGVYDFSSQLSSVAFSTTKSGNYFSFYRLSGPAVTAATESVNAFYTGTPTGVIPSNFTTTDPVTFPNLVKDTHVGYSAGTYTIKSSGSYAISASFSISAATITAGNYSALAIYKNSATAIGVQVLRAAVSSANGTTTNSVTIPAYPFNAGDTVTVLAANNNTTPAFSSGLLSGGENFFSIARVGN